MATYEANVNPVTVESALNDRSESDTLSNSGLKYFMGGIASSAATVGMFLEDFLPSSVKTPSVLLFGAAAALSFWKGQENFQAADSLDGIPTGYASLHRNY